jgi:hypothetical protein
MTRTVTVAHNGNLVKFALASVLSATDCPPTWMIHVVSREARGICRAVAVDIGDECATRLLHCRRLPSSD